jgi:hypothetical protein
MFNALLFSMVSAHGFLVSPLGFQGTEPFRILTSACGTDADGNDVNIPRFNAGAAQNLVPGASVSMTWKQENGDGGGPIQVQFTTDLSGLTLKNPDEQDQLKEAEVTKQVPGERNIAIGNRGEQQFIFTVPSDLSCPNGCIMRVKQLNPGAFGSCAFVQTGGRANQDDASADDNQSSDGGARNQGRNGNRKKKNGANQGDASADDNQSSDGGARNQGRNGNRKKKNGANAANQDGASAANNQSSDRGARNQGRNGNRNNENGANAANQGDKRAARKAEKANQLATKRHLEGGAGAEEVANQDDAGAEEAANQDDAGAEEVANQDDGINGQDSKAIKAERAAKRAEREARKAAGGNGTNAANQGDVSADNNQSSNQGATKKDKKGNKKSNNDGNQNIRAATGRRNDNREKN